MLKSGYRSDIDGLRAFAVLAVILYHAFPALLPTGFIGVDVFFVISGYLISGIIFNELRTDTFSVIKFYRRRILRIFPALLVVLITSYAIGWFILFPDIFSLLGKHIAASAGFVQNIVLWNEHGYFDTASEHKPLLHLWSLAIEEQFYLLYPVAVFVVWKWRLRLVLPCLLLAITLSFLLNLKGMHSLPRDAVATFFLPHTRFWELLTGAVTAYLTLEQARPTIFRERMTIMSARNVMSLAGFALILFSLGQMHNPKVFPGWHAVPSVLGTALLLFAGAEGIANRIIFNSKIAGFIGRISYPLYLWHWPLLAFARIESNIEPSARTKVEMLLLSFVLAVVTYFFIERPVRFSPGRNCAKVLALLGGTLIIGCLGYASYKNPVVFNEEKQAVFEQIHWKPEWLVSPTCHALYKLDRKEFENCTTNVVDGIASIALIGDSHSNHYWPGLSEMPSVQVTNLGNNGCLAFPDIDLGLCARKTPLIMERIDTLPEITTVVLAGYDMLYFSGYRYGADASKGLTIQLSSAHDEKDPHKVFLKALQQTLKHLSSQHKAIVFIVDVPELGFDPRFCVEEQSQSLIVENLKRCAIRKSAYFERSEQYRQGVARVLEDFPAVVVFDPSSILCSDKWCYARHNNQLLYRDTDHLSLEGSRLLAPHLLHTIHQAQKNAKQFR